MEIDRQHVFREPCTGGAQLAAGESLRAYHVYPGSVFNADRARDFNGWGMIFESQQNGFSADGRLWCHRLLHAQTRLSACSGSARSNSGRKDGTVFPPGPDPVPR